MSTSEQKQQQTIIYVEHECDTVYEVNTSYQPQIDLENQPELPVSCKSYDNTYTAYYIDERFVVIRIDSTDTLVKIEYPWRSKLLHVHIIEHLCPVCNIYGNEFDEVSGHTIFVIFNDHILRICLTNISNVSSFKECKTDFSFRISETESSSFRIIEDDRNNCLRACLVLDEHCWKKVELFEINLFPDDECIFIFSKNTFIRLPPNITEIEINLEDGYVILTMKLISQHGSLDFSIYIDFREDGESDSIFLLNNFERCILATRDQLDRFQKIGFEIVATIRVHTWEDHDDFPEIKEFINVMLEELNKYHTCHQDDSDDGSDAD
jgi:hypothetical protein